MKILFKYTPEEEWARVKVKARLFKAKRCHSKKGECG